MARSYRASNGRIIPRRGGGQFRRTTLQDFGISQSELSDGNMICANCGYGEGAEKWRPVLKTGYCPKCKSQEKRQPNNSVYTDAGDSAASTGISQASAFPTSRSDATEPQRG